MSIGSSSNVSRRAPTRILRSSRPPSASSAAEAETRRQLHAELGERGAEVRFGDDAGLAVPELVEVTARGGAVERPLFGFELAGFDEGLAARQPGLGLREPGVGLDPVGYREAHVGRLVRIALASADLTREAPAAHVLGPAQSARA